MAYTELTVWTRGIIMDKEGRDIVNSVAASARLEGKFAQAMENYVCLLYTSPSPRDS